ncbi:cysteine hydrolase family protein [Mycoplasmopsis verecunda]|uniref:Nicotinamidase-related amidase n=1 Tax=Mycoplasmopsis verecunda TaxID=171291 RepID=A0A1T4KNA8_9BACT|nr:isochorismatase family cysteine hydrolase [Mycoplasmopsis verecunda]WPB54309.1 isochorismatase family cysteine hydrolase [Mycoplasmopsis verecunda]SJZ43896.1 Nicotinamidase-related amidase [Mycoplasmopsis verecunda]
MNKKLLIVVDMLKGFAYEGPLASEKVAEVIPTIANMVQEFDHNLFVADHHYEDDLEMKIYPLHCLGNDTESEIVDELKPFVQNIVYKNTTDSIWAIPIKTWDMYDEFHIVGCCTDICILQLVLSLRTYLNSIKADKNIIVYSNAVATYDSPDHQAELYHDMALNLMKNAGVKIKEWEM